MALNGTVVVRGDAVVLDSDGFAAMRARHLNRAQSFPVSMVVFLATVKMLSISLVAREGLAAIGAGHFNLGGGFVSHRVSLTLECRVQRGANGCSLFFRGLGVEQRHRVEY